MQWHITCAIIRSILLRGAYLRVGEAKNPGPCEDSKGLTIGCFNPTGIMYKTDSIHLIPNRGSAIWGVSESHLSKPGIQKFHQELVFKKSRYKFLPGAPAPLKSTSASSIGGKQLGVGFLTDLPARQLPHSWPASCWHEARFTMQTFFYQQQWLFGATFYGFAHRADTQEVKNQTDELLSHVTHRLVVNMKGMRFIVGDFNQTEGQLQQTAIWKSYGWREIQMMAHDLYGKPIQNTCRGTTTKDYVWISPELQPFFLDTEISDVFPDHVALCAHFSPFGRPEPIYLWPKPKPIAWKEIEGKLEDQHFNQKVAEFSNTDEFMKQVSLQFEQWQDFLVQYLERVQYSGFKPCAVSRVTRYKIYAIMSFLCCTYYPNRAVCTPLHGLQLTHCSIGSASLEFGFSISNQQGALVSLKPLAGYAAGVHYLLCE